VRTSWFWDYAVGWKDKTDRLTDTLIATLHTPIAPLGHIGLRARHARLSCNRRWFATIANIKVYSHRVRYGAARHRTAPIERYRKCNATHPVWTKLNSPVNNQASRVYAPESRLYTRHAPLGTCPTQIYLDSEQEAKQIMRTVRNCLEVVILE